MSLLNLNSDIAQKEKIAQAIIQHCAHLWPINTADQAQATKPRYKIVKALTGGLTNSSFIIQLNDQNNSQYVLRINDPDSIKLGINRLFEYIAHDKSQQLGLSPKLISHGVYLHQLQGKHHEINYCLRQYVAVGQIKQTLNLDDDIILLAETVAQLHNIKLSKDQLYPLSLLQRADNLWLNINSNNYPQLKPERDYIDQALQIFAKQKHHIGLCHFDLIKENILFEQDKINIIDWEYAAVSDQYFDLASVFSSYQLNPQQQTLFSQHYLCALDIHNEETLDKTRLKLCQLAVQYLSLLWYATQGQLSEQQLAEGLSDIKTEISSLPTTV